MKKVNYRIKSIGQILFVIIFFISPAKSLDKFNKAERISDYFSGILLLNDSQYEKSLGYLKKLKGLEKSPAYTHNHDVRGRTAPLHI